ncbi:glycosyltransferase [Dictyoglomus thermophilum]|uniref:Glycosyl transferase, group 1 n=1 Tax=Dictyoglomus thermophilum (strain ATCC 35947 / DSM 3960 / H-6-12) TaxID=309799 RepID=B5YBY5_DICT6|nr:glycosyltransferase [Dictyoglomus thermophilum]ACI18893.1 glycosyl transferase, group 1 [Dictyoglomus thermophilum H-6-12]
MSRSNLEITIIVSPSLPVPPFKGYGGTQRGVWELIKYLREDYKIRLFAPGSSSVEVDTLMTNIPFGLWEEGINLSKEERAILQKSYDRFVIDSLNSNPPQLINIHYDSPFIIRQILQRFNCPIIYSPHNQINTEIRLILEDLIAGRIKREAPFIIIALSLSHYHEIIKGIPMNFNKNKYIKIIPIYYGCDVEDFPFSPFVLTDSPEEPSIKILKSLKRKNINYFITIGRICKIKGQLTAIKLIKEIKGCLIIAGSVFEREKEQEMDYYKKVLEQCDGKDIIYYGTANEDEKRELMKYAVASLYFGGSEDPYWREPFGRVLVESLAVGTPVIAWNQGAITEVIIDGLVGFVVKTFDECILKINHVKSIDRYLCRMYVDKIFSSRRVAREYKSLIKDVLV